MRGGNRGGKGLIARHKRSPCRSVWWCKIPRRSKFDDNLATSRVKSAVSQGVEIPVAAFLHARAAVLDKRCSAVSHSRHDFIRQEKLQCLRRYSGFLLPSFASLPCFACSAHRRRRKRQLGRRGRSTSLFRLARARALTSRRGYSPTNYRPNGASRWWSRTSRA